MNKLLKIKIFVLMVSPIIGGGLGLYYIYLGGKGEASSIKADIIGASADFFIFLMLIITYLGAKKKLRGDHDKSQKSMDREGIRAVMIGIAICVLIFVLALFSFLRHLLKS
jgi:uncharacterized membrane protein